MTTRTTGTYSVDLDRLREHLAGGGGLGRVPVVRARGSGASDGRGGALPVRQTSGDHHDLPGLQAWRAKMGMSWTINRPQAEWFARRLANDEDEPRVVSGTVSEGQGTGLLHRARRVRDRRLPGGHHGDERSQGPEQGEAEPRRLLEAVAIDIKVADSQWTRTHSLRRATARRRHEHVHGAGQRLGALRRRRLDVREVRQSSH
jgi:hypothetical protein